ncbi:MAG: hypothetical protein IT423_10195 [Pirellulaceae bacterium]|nr:hypothetical protein [Pirellulaceae bacterium]
MTLLLRKKLQTTVQSMRSQVRAHKLRPSGRRPTARSADRSTGRSRSLLLGLLLAGIASELVTTNLLAQAPNAATWQPSRLPASGSMRPLAGVASGSASATIRSSQAESINPGYSAKATGATAQATAAEATDAGVVLRWRTSTRVSHVPADNSSARVTQSENYGQPVSMASHTLDSTAQMHAPGARAANYRASTAIAQDTQTQTWSANPLRASGAAQPAARPAQVAQVTARQRSVQPGGYGQVSAVQPAAYQLPPVPPAAGTLGDQAPPSIEPPPLNLPSTPPQPMPSDALSQPELPPAPPSISPAPPEVFSPPQINNQAPQSNPAAPDQTNQLRLPGLDEPPTKPEIDASPDPFQNLRSDLDSPSDRSGQDANDRSADLEKPRSRPDATANCEAFRDSLRNASLQKINLNSSPRFGQGIKDGSDESEQMRLDFAAGSESRDWCDRHGRTILQGRMVDLINEQVVLDVNGVRREIALRDLCDVDLAYVGKVWNLPISCGSGYEQVAGRSFVPSAIQWKASGLCHKPLYFEEVQLERYGHEIGPVLQPLVSTAHFFGNIVVLPYKMGIHPPHECQYALGYYRPGDCAPYMLPPVPISLRGAAVQTGAVLGAAALVP